jgi:hypothetical protein
MSIVDIVKAVVRIPVELIWPTKASEAERAAALRVEIPRDVIHRPVDPALGFLDQPGWSVHRIDHDTGTYVACHHGSLTCEEAVDLVFEQTNKAGLAFRTPTGEYLPIGDPDLPPEDT